MLRKATKLEDIAGSFDPMALETAEEMREFYVDTMEARTGDPYDSPIDNIEDYCKQPRSKNAMLLLGHRGCGKSTELNRMKLRLEAEGRQVIMILCDEQLSLQNKPLFSDLLILMGEALYQKALELDVPVSGKTLERIKNFWTPVVQVRETVREEETSADAKAKLGIEGFVASLFVKLKSDVKNNDKVRQTSETHIESHYADWRMILESLSIAITDKIGKQPVVIFEGLDHLENLKEARELFFDHAGKLTDVSFPVIYTFPIALYYDERFPSMQDSLRGYETLPMLKLETPEGEPYPQGSEELRNIVERRAEVGEDNVIAPDALDLMIAKTGGSLRDLFEAIRMAGKRALKRETVTRTPQRIVREDAEAALKKMQSHLTRRIEGDEHKFLAKICVEDKRKIEDTAKLLKALQARVALEYNGERWHNVHPLVADYLAELGYIKRKDDGKGWEAGERLQSGGTA